MNKILQDAYPLSPMQSGLLFQSLYAPNSDAYFVQMIFNMLGEIDRDILRKAWQRTSDFHPILRTGFMWENLENPLQYVLESTEVPFKVEDWLQTENVEERLKNFIKEDRKKGFDLSEAPLFRVTLIQYAPNHYYLIWSQHHILTDGWSTSIILDDLFKAYEDIRQEKAVKLRVRPLYRSYIAWLQAQELPKAEAFWKEYLSTIEGPSQLSFKGMIEEDKEKDYDTYSTIFSLEDTENLIQFAQNNNLTLNTLLQGAVGLILKHYTRQPEVVIGVTVSGRNIDLPGVEEMVGIFINTLPLKISVTQESNVLSFLHTLQEQTQKINEYAYTPLAQIQSWTNKSQQLFDVIFVFENYPIEKESNKVNSKFNITEVKGIEKTEYPLTIVVAPGKQLYLGLSYQTEHFNKEIISRLAEHIKIILHELLSQRQVNPTSLPLLTASEKKQILIEWNDTKTGYPEDKAIHQLFEAQVEKTPNSVALVYESEQLSYQELNQRANQLAHYLRSKGVGPDTLVAIAVERSLEMVIGLLGILKAGGAYVPLDPNYPPERLQFMLEDTKASILLTQAHLKNKFIEGTKQDSQAPSLQRTIICLDKDWGLVSAQPVINLAPITRSHHLAYVIYTSGSTGVPKGVAVEHKSLVNRLVWMQNQYSLTNQDSILQKTAFIFDVSIWEIFTPLLSGAQTILARSDSQMNPEYIISLIKNNRINLLEFIPSFLEAILKHINISDIPNLKIAISGSETLHANVVKDFYQLLPNSKLYNSYGPTEATIDVTYYLCDPIKKSTVIPIGKPISNTEMYILDTHLNPLPIGVAGEIYIGGAGLARGYLNRPDLTAEKFIPNPFVTKEDAEAGKNLRLYRTGDLGRYLSDGNIDFLGRIDDQVKIRGFRIELGEIETTLQNYRAVSQVVVVAREDESGNKRLMAYVVPEEDILTSFTTDSPLMSSAGEPFSTLRGNSLSVLTEELRNHLGRSLPDYMVPSFFVYIDKIPLTPNGKIDRKALPEPDASSRLIGGTYVAPTTEIEQKLASVWSEVLKVDKIGINDNFFRIGGDSIISIQLVSKARQKGIYFAVKDVFKHPTIKALASIAQREAKHTTADQGTVVGEAPLTPIQHWFFSSNLSENHYFNQAVLLKPSLPLDLSYLNKTISILVTHHDALRFRYHQDKNHQWHQKAIEKDDHVLCSQIDLSHISIDALPSEIEKESTNIQASLDLEKGPVLRAVLFDCNNQEQRLLIVIHHLVVDGVSWRILLEDLEKVYGQIHRDETPSLPAKTHSYQQWGKALQEYASSNSLQEEIPYWQQIEEHVQPIPTDFALGPITWSTTQTIEVSLTKEETTNLLQRVPKAYKTEINDILLTALVLAIGDLTKKYNLTLALEGHGREDIIKEIDLSRTVGWFTSIFPAYLQIDNPKRIGEAIKAIKETLRHIPQKGIGYGILKYLTEKTSFVNNTYSAIIFNYLGQWDNTMKEDSLFTYAPESVGNTVSEQCERSHLLDISVKIREGKLQIFWSYSTNHYEKDTIEQLSHTFNHRLQEIIRHCLSKNTSDYSMSDFHDFKPYVIINDSIKETNNNLFILPPGEGGSESYFNNIVPRLDNKKLILFNNYYDYLKNKFDKNYVNHITFETLAADYIHYIKLIQPKGPYSLFGWSFGGTLAFEIARQLMKKGDTVTNIILLDAFFNFKEAVSKTDNKKFDETDINYKYAPSIVSELSQANIILFKALKAEDKDCIFKYFVKNTKYNNLDSLISSEKIQVIEIDATHFSWINNDSQIIKICNTIRNCK